MVPLVSWQVIVGTEDGYARAEALTVSAHAGFQGLRRCEHLARTGLGLRPLEGPDTPVPGVRRLDFLGLHLRWDSPAALASSLEGFEVRYPFGLAGCRLLCAGAAHLRSSPRNRPSPR